MERSGIQVPGERSEDILGSTGIMHLLQQSCSYEPWLLDRFIEEGVDGILLATTCWEEGIEHLREAMDVPVVIWNFGPAGSLGSRPDDNVVSISLPFVWPEIEGVQMSLQPGFIGDCSSEEGFSRQDDVERRPVVTCADVETLFQGPGAERTMTSGMDPDQALFDLSLMVLMSHPELAGDDAFGGLAAADAIPASADIWNEGILRVPGWPVLSASHKALEVTVENWETGGGGESLVERLFGRPDQTTTGDHCDTTCPKDCQNNCKKQGDKECCSSNGMPAPDYARWSDG